RPDVAGQLAETEADQRIFGKTGDCSFAITEARDHGETEPHFRRVGRRDAALDDHVVPPLAGRTANHYRWHGRAGAILVALLKSTIGLGKRLVCVLLQAGAGRAHGINAHKAALAAIAHGAERESVGVFSAGPSWRCSEDVIVNGCHAADRRMRSGKA